MKKRLLKFLLGCPVLLLAACQSTEDAGQYDQIPAGVGASPSAEALVPSSAPLKRYEVIDVYVLEDQSFNGSYTVRESGDVILPRVGRVKVLGLSPSAVESVLKSTLESSQLTNASVIVERTKRNDSVSADGSPSGEMLIYVTGGAKRPGQHSIRTVPGRSYGVYECVLITGGLDELADERNIELRRQIKGGEQISVKLDFRKIRKGEEKDPRAYSGDIIVVPSKNFSF